MTSLPVVFNDADAYELFMGRWSRAAGSDFLDWLAPARNVVWLDAGCGTGIFTQLILDKCEPSAVFAIDPAQEQVEYARRKVISERVNFQVANALQLPFEDGRFDIVVAALVLNFIPDLHTALAEIRRVTRDQGCAAADGWEFESDLSPSGPLRRSMRRFGLDVPEVPGTAISNIGALRSVFRSAGFETIASITIDITVSYADFDDFWLAQNPRYSPTTHLIETMTSSERQKLIDYVRSELSMTPEGRITYTARASAIKAVKSSPAY